MLSVIPKSFGGQGDTITKRMTLPNLVIQTATQIIPVTTSADTTLVQSAPASEWASFAARYQQYRVKAIRVVADPVSPVNTGLGANSGHSQLYIADFVGTAVPTTAAQVLSDENGSVTSTSRRWTKTVTWARNPNAKLWNPTSAVVPAANSYGIAWASNTNANLMAGNPDYYFAYMIEWIVEFRGSQ
jgi:hypothetical protein